MEKTMENTLKQQILDARLEEMAAREKIVAKLRELGLSSRTTKLFCDNELGYSQPETRQILAHLGLILTSDAMTSSDPNVLMKIEKLKSWRRETARREGVPAYRVLTNRVLMKVAEERPSDESKLLEIKGVGELSGKKYGSEILQLLTCES